MKNQNKMLIETLHELGLTPLDWVDAKQFAALTGISEQKLTYRKQKWPENVVWTKQDGNLYYSIRGYNEWMSQQAERRYRKACGLDLGASRSTLGETVEPITSRSLTPSMRRVSKQLLRLEVI